MQEETGGSGGDAARNERTKEGTTFLGRSRVSNRIADSAAIYEGAPAVTVGFINRKWNSLLNLQSR